MSIIIIIIILQSFNLQAYKPLPLSQRNSNNQIYQVFNISHEERDFELVKILTTKACTALSKEDRMPGNLNSKGGER